MFDSTDDSGDATTTALKWMFRSYESSEEWKKKSETIFLSLNGECDLARARVASMARKYFVEEKPAAEDIDRWADQGNVIEKVRVVPPKISESNAGYVDWLFVADYCLLSSAVVDAFSEENQRREAEYLQLERSYQLRMQVHAARKIINSHSAIDDEAVLAELQKTYKDASLANIKEARRQERSKVKNAVPKKPNKGGLLERYSFLNF